MGRHERAPVCWTPPASLVHLPEGEAVRVQPMEVYFAPAAHPPPTAPGFRRAAELGLLPPPAPPLPPAPVPGLSSWDRLRLAVLLFFGGILLSLLLGNGLGQELLAGLAGTAAAGAAFWLFFTIPARDEVEHAAGYTSGASTTGLWRLAGDGRVLRPPDPEVLPPGWYPSPYYPGVLQAWDGPSWKPFTQFWWKREHLWFRRPPVPFL